MKILAAIVAIWVAYWVGRGHEARAWVTACETPTPDDIDWLQNSDTYPAAVLRTILGGVHD